MRMRFWRRKRRRVVKTPFDAVFIGPTRTQCLFWAKQWGYEPGRVLFITDDRRLRGCRLDGIPVFGCGSAPPENWNEIKMILTPCGVNEIIDAQIIDVVERGTQWLN